MTDFKFENFSYDGADAHDGEANASYGIDVIVNGENVGAIYWTVNAYLKLTYCDYDPGYWGPTMADSEPESLDFDYELDDVGVLLKTIDVDVADDDLKNELTNLLPKLIEDGVLLDSFTEEAEDDIYESYLDWLWKHVK